jgi:hypothetical protein
MGNFKCFYGPEHFTPAPNSSGKFWNVLMGYMGQYSKTGDSLLLVAEPKECCPLFYRYNLSFIDNLGYSGEKGCEYKVDLNVIAQIIYQYNIVFSQALLEHVCRPSVAIENMVNLTLPGGYIMIHSHNPEMPYHGFPHDCCRFFKDFFIDLCKYLPVEMVEYDEWGRNIYTCYRKLK